MIASLMMYARPELAGAHRRYWALIRHALQQRGIASPAELSQEADEYFVWQHPDLLLSQTCGMPFRQNLHETVALIGTPDYKLPGCLPGYYCSVLIVRQQDRRSSLTQFKQSTFAYNSLCSHSGFCAAYWHVRSAGFWFENKLQTGQHVESARAVAESRADMASIDAVSWRLICRYESFAKQLRVLDRTQPSPGLPLISSKKNDADSIYRAVRDAINALSDVDRALLGIASIVKIARSKYLEISDPPAASM